MNFDLKFFGGIFD